MSTLDKHVIHTYSGQPFNVFRPRPSDVHFRDVAVQLTRRPRWNGSTSGPAHEVYVVAQHSVLVSCVVGMVSPRDALWGFLHDWAEAYLVDLPRPIKTHPSMAAFEKVEDGIMRKAILPFVRQQLPMTYRLPTKQPAIVTLADNILLATERRDMHWPSPKVGVVPLAASINRWSMRKAYERFHQRWDALVQAHWEHFSDASVSALDAQAKAWGIDPKRERAVVAQLHDRG